MNAEEPPPWETLHEGVFDEIARQSEGRVSFPSSKHDERLEEIRAIANHPPNQRPSGYSPASIQALVDVFSALEAAEADARQKAEELARAEAIVEAASVLDACLRNNRHLHPFDLNLRKLLDARAALVGRA